MNLLGRQKMPQNGSQEFQPDVKPEMITKDQEPCIAVCPLGPAEVSVTR
jgi:hypothetical protein